MNAAHPPSPLSCTSPFLFLSLSFLSFHFLLGSRLYCFRPWMEGSDILGTVCNEEDGDFEHLEYLPIVNTRAHKLGKELTILNSALSEQYRRTLERLCHKSKLSDADWMALTYYLLLQVS